MGEITDAMIDRFYGEYERPTNNKASACRCSGCERDLHFSDNVIVTEEGIFCEDCASEIIDEIFRDQTLREKADVMGYTFCEAGEAVAI